MAEDTTLRDSLARDRTALANERTLLAYVRTGLGLVGLAVIVIKFGEGTVSAVTGMAALAAALFVFAWGVRSFNLVRERIDPGSRSEAVHEERSAC